MSQLKTFFRPGCYRGRVIGQFFKRASTQTWQLVLRFVILDDPASEKQRCVYLSLAPGARDFTTAALQAINFDAANMRLLKPDTPGRVDLSGRECMLSCRHEYYRGVTREKWRIEGSHNSESLELGPNDWANIEQVFGRGAPSLSALPAPQPAPQQQLPWHPTLANPPVPEISANHKPQEPNGRQFPQ